MRAEGLAALSLRSPTVWSPNGEKLAKDGRFSEAICSTGDLDAVGLIVFDGKQVFTRLARRS